MKKLCMFLLLLAPVVTGLKAQTFSEWFRQKKTQKNYLMQQIAALRVYVDEAQRGYEIIREGMTRISDFTGGELGLHTQYFSSLKSVNPEILRYTKVPEIISLQARIIQNSKRASWQLNSSDAFSAGEQAYFNRVLSRLMEDSDNALDELISITTGGQLEMTDGERLKRIDRIYDDVQDKLAFSQIFCGDRVLNAVSKIKEQTDVQTSRVLQGLKNK